MGPIWAALVASAFLALAGFAAFPVEVPLAPVAVLELPLGLACELCGLAGPGALCAKAALALRPAPAQISALVATQMSPCRMRFAHGRWVWFTEGWSSAGGRRVSGGLFITRPSLPRLPALVQGVGTDVLCCAAYLKRLCQAMGTRLAVSACGP